MWIPGMSRIEYPRASHQPFRGGPVRVVLHKMQGGLAGTLATYPRTLAIPHFSWDYPSRRRIQHRPLNEMASALMNRPGGVETNADGAIQIEISGKSEDAAGISDEELVWYGEGLAELRQHVDFQLAAPVFKDVGDAAGVNASTRMSFAEWDGFNGVCGHQHVPENDHWDPGALDISKVLAAAGAPEPSEEDDMPAFAMAINGEDRIERFSIDPNGRAVTSWQATEGKLTYSPWTPLGEFHGAPFIEIAAATKRDGCIVVNGLTRFGGTWQIRQSKGKSGGYGWGAWTEVPS